MLCPVDFSEPSRSALCYAAAVADHFGARLIDLTSASSYQLTVAGGIAAALSVPLIIAHMLEPVFVTDNVRLAIPGAESARRADAEERLSALTRSLDAESRCLRYMHGAWDLDRDGG